MKGIGKSIQQIHNRIAETYGGGIYQPLSPEQRSIRGWEVRLCTRMYDETCRALVPGSVTMDAGGGNGQWAQWLMQYDPRDTMVVDFASEMLRYAKKRAENWGYAEKQTEINADLESLPFVNGQFDFVHLFGVIEHLDHPREVLQELLRCTRTGGALFVNIPRLWSLNFLVYMVTGISPRRWDVGGRSVLARIFDILEYSSKLRFYHWFSERQIRHLFDGLPCRILKRIPGVYLPVTGIVAPRILSRLARSPRGQSLMTTINTALARGLLPPAGEMYLLIKQ